MKPRIPHNQRARRSASRPGFTLVEVLLSLSLMVVLMVGIYAAMDTFRAISTTGRDQNERAQIARALQQKMSTDIRSVLAPPEPEEEESTDEAADEEDIPEEEIVEEVDDPADASSSGSKGVVGNATMLVLNISKPPRGLNYSSNSDNPSPLSVTSDMLSVTYLIAGDSGNTLTQIIASNEGMTGLARIAGDRLMIDELDEDINEDAIAQSARVIAEEVDALLFEYFDGTDWLETWDSRATGTLPRAIRVTIGFRMPGDDGANISLDERPSSHRKTFVVTLPASDPTPPSLLDLGL